MMTPPLYLIYFPLLHGNGHQADAPRCLATAQQSRWLSPLPAADHRAVISTVTTFIHINRHMQAGAAALLAVLLLVSVCQASEVRLSSKVA